ncbi:MAG: hypothetical protein OEV66_09840 [Spirochaetia bacterium]|nr:hypothetical protein [Spirochaetia bacterium]
MKQTRWVGGLLILSVIFFVSQCKSTKGSADNEKEQNLLVLNDLTYKEDPEINAIARLIGAKPLPEGSSLLPVANSAEYKKYYDDINSAWSTFESKHLNLVDKWVGDHATRQCGPNLFYPFSGPDILHALEFYPDAQTIQMFALERFGGMPHPDPTHPDHEAKKMFSLLDAIKSSLNYHYFITSYMSGQVGENEYSGVIGIMLFALARLEIQVLDVYPVIINPQGHLERSPENKYSKVDAVAVFFKKPSDKKARVVLYFKGDASDSGLAKNPHLQVYLQSLKGYSTLLKAASNLMYDKTFDDMRTQILAQSKCIISDDSGIPFHYLNNGNWNIKLYGVYNGPLVYFKNRFDPFLYREIKEKAGPLPFDYGYRRGEGMSHIIFSERKADYPYFAPKYDLSSDIGDTTSWNNGQFYVVTKPDPKDIEGRLKYKDNEPEEKGK